MLLKIHCESIITENIHIVVIEINMCVDSTRFQILGVRGKTSNPKKKAYALSSIVYQLLWSKDVFSGHPN